MTKHVNRCSACGGALTETRISYTQELDGQLFVVRGVPALVCRGCDEEYLAPETVDALQDLIERGSRQPSLRVETLEVPVFRFDQAVA